MLPSAIHPSTSRFMDNWDSDRYFVDYGSNLTTYKVRPQFSCPIIPFGDRNRVKIGMIFVKRVGGTNRANELDSSDWGHGASEASCYWWMVWAVKDL